MATFGTLTRRIQLRTGNRIDVVRAGQILRAKIEEVFEDYSWSFLKKEGILSTVAPKSNGTVSLNGSDATKIDGTGTSFTASDVDSFIRIGNDTEFYKITAVSGQQLTIETAYIGSSFTNSSYTVFRHIYSLPSDVRRIISPAHYRRLSESTHVLADRFDARRTFTGNFPWAFIYRGYDSSGNLQIEIRPVPSAAFGIRYVYLSRLTIPEENDPALETFSVPLPPLVWEYSCAAEALFSLLAAQPNLDGAGTLLRLAERYMQLGELALQRERESDFARAGSPKQVLDEDMILVGDDILYNHDLLSP